MLLDAIIAKGITRIEPSNDPSNDILIVSINGSQIELGIPNLVGTFYR